MNATAIDEDLQILRATLVVVGNELNRWSPEAFRAVENAVRNLDRAREEFSQSRELPAFEPGEPCFYARAERLRRRAAPPSAAAPIPMSAHVEGSGTGVKFR